MVDLDLDFDYCDDQSDLDLSFCLSEPDDQPQSVNVNLSNGSPLNSHDFIVAHWNVNSVLKEGRLDELFQNIQTLKAQVIVLTESKLDSSIPSNIITFPGFHEPLRRDRNRHGGGCLVYISQQLIFKQQSHIQSDYFENISVDIRVKEKVYSINCYYRPPDAENHELFLGETEKMLGRLSSHKANTKIILSDLNFGNIYCKFPTLNPKPLDTVAPELFTSFNFHQLIDIPTRVTNNTTALIDLVFTSNVDNISCHSTLPPVADHEGVFVSFHCVQAKENIIKKCVYDYSNIDEIGLRDFIKKYDFQTKVFDLPIIQQAHAMTNILNAAQNKYVPVKTIVIKPNDQPWVNSCTRLLMRKKNRNYHIFKKVNSAFMSLLNKNSPSEELVTRLREKKCKASKRARLSANESTKANLRAKNAFFNTVNVTIQNYEISAKKKFSILTKLMKNQKTSNIPPLLHNGEIINDPKTQSELFNNHFVSKATVPGNDDTVSFLSTNSSISSPLAAINTSPIEVSKILRQLKKSNTSHCGISGKFINIIATPISFSLSRMFNNCFEIGHFPDIF